MRTVDIRRRQVRVQCPECRIEFIVPNEKIPQGKGLKILCPKCKNPLDIKESAPSGSMEEVVDTASESPGTSFFPDPASDYQGDIDLVEEGVKTALLCCSDLKRAEKIARALQELDFWVVHAVRAAFALGKLHHNHYDLIVLDENFDAAKPTENLVLHHVQLLPMHGRRQFFLCLLSETKPTLDAMLAFRTGVNMVLNTQDIEKAKIIFARAMKDHKAFYSVFNQELNKKQG